MKEGTKATAIAVGLLLLIGAAGRSDLDALPECGLIREGSEWIERSCMTADELAERMDAVRRAQGGDRFDDN